MLHVCCVHTSNGEYIAMVKTGTHVSSQLACWCSVTLFQPSFSVSLNALLGVLHEERSTKRTTEPDTAQTERILTRLWWHPSLESRLHQSSERVLHTRVCHILVLFLARVARTTHVVLGFNTSRICSNRISRRHDRTRSTTRTIDHTCIRAVHRQWCKTQVCQISEHTEERAERTEKKENTGHGRGRKISPQKTWIPPILHPHTTQPTTRAYQNEQIDKTCFGWRTNSDQNMCKWISQVPHISRHRSWSPRNYGKTVDKKLVATTGSSGFVGIRRRI